LGKKEKAVPKRKKP